MYILLIVVKIKFDVFNKLIIFVLKFIIKTLFLVELVFLKVKYKNLGINL